MRLMYNVLNLHVHLYLASNYMPFLAGPAHDNPILSSKASFRYPAGIDVLRDEPGKNEIAFVCDKGNSCIRFIKGVHSLHVDKFVGKLKLISAPVNWKPEGLAVLGKTNKV